MGGAHAGGRTRKSSSQVGLSPAPVVDPIGDSESDRESINNCNDNCACTFPATVTGTVEVSVRARDRIVLRAHMCTAIIRHES